MLRKSVLVSKMAMTFTIISSILDQAIDSLSKRYQLKKATAKKLILLEGSGVDSSPVSVVTATAGGQSVVALFA